MSDHVLVVGGTRFIGRRAVETFRDAGYDVTVFNRGEHHNPFTDEPDVEHLRGDRTDDSDLATAAAVDPDVVVDTVAYHPRDVRAATRAFDGVDAYVYVSSGAAYGAEEIPKREGETALHPCSAEQAADGGADSYGPRKAEGDRAVFDAAERGVNATSVRPTVVYGPHDYSGYLDYWIRRVAARDRVLVPGDGSSLWHLAAVENVARAIRVVAEDGVPGEAYNVGDWTLLTLSDVVRAVADALDTEVTVATAGERELATADLEPTDFPLYRPTPHVLDTHKLRSLGWDPVAPDDAIAEAVETSPVTDAGESTAFGIDDSTASPVADGPSATDAAEPEQGPDRAAEERVLAALDAI